MKRNRKSIRLQNYNYSQPGYYFITICVYQNKNIFGNIVGAGPCTGPIFILNEFGFTVQSIWSNIPKFYPNTEIDEFVVMPNHFHGIVIISKNNGRTQRSAPTLSLSNIIQRFKSLTTTRYRQMTDLPTKLWQRSFYDHIIRNERNLNRIRQYIINNPARWDLDENNPKNIKRSNHDKGKSKGKYYHCQGK